MYQQKIGIIGGFGAYATLNFYKRILESFASESERNYPHIIMDNNFTMPSRTRALLYDEEYDEIVRSIAKSMKLMLDQQADKIILVCGTAHCFLKDVYQIIPQARERVMDIIEILGGEINRQGQTNALVIAAEGALLKEIYPLKLKKYGISCINPQKEYYEEIRYFIECVKQNNINTDSAVRFITFLEGFSSSNIILGCTEFPILVNYIHNLSKNEIMEQQWKKYKFYDPLETVIQELKRILI